MGGYGSGRQGSLPIIEQGLKLDLWRLQRQRLFVPSGNESWTTIVWRNSATGEKTARCELRYCAGNGKGWLRLKYHVTPYGRETGEINDLFVLEPIAQPFGGVRWYIICPTTGRRCQCLYLPCGAYHFRSRQGFNCRLLYSSQKQDRRSRLFDRSRREAAKVLRRGPLAWRQEYADWEFPPKPPRMHWKTYHRMLTRWEESERQADAILSAWILKLGDI